MQNLPVDGFRNPANQLRLMVVCFPSFYEVLAPSQVVRLFFHQQYELEPLTDASGSINKKPGKYPPTILDLHKVVGKIPEEYFPKFGNFMVMNAMGSNPYNHLKNKSKKPKNKHAPKQNIHPKNHWTLHLEGYESVFRRSVLGCSK